MKTREVEDEDSEDDVVEVDGAAERSMRRGSRVVLAFALGGSLCPPLEP